MSQNPAHDKVKSFLPSDAEIDRALEQALREGGPTGVAPGLRDVRENTAIDARVLRVTDDQVLCDIGYKTEGVIALAEFGDAPPAPGTALEAWVMRLEDKDGQVELSVLEARRRKVFGSVSEGRGTGQVFPAKVLREVKGGLVVDLGVEGFLPAREVDLRFVEDLSVWVGKTVEVEIIETEPDRRRVVVSRKNVLRRARAAQRDRLFETLAPGQKLKGTVTSVTGFGAFVDIGGAEGLLHVGDMAWGRVENPADVVKPGDEVEVVVLTFDRTSGKIGLGLKQTAPSPFEAAGDRLAPGRRFKGKVSGLLDFGALVEIMPGVKGMVHVSEMAWGRRVNKPSDVVQLGDEVEVEVLEVDPSKQKIALSMKRVEENPWTSLADRYPVPCAVRGRVTRLADFGAFIEVESGVEGLCHVSELSWTTRVDHPGQILKVGDEVDAMVIGIDHDRQRLSLSIRKTEPDPWWDVETDFPVGRTFEGKVTRTKPFGAFVELRKGLEGLVHVSNMGSFGDGSRFPVRVGSLVSVEILECSEEHRKMGLRLVEIL